VTWEDRACALPYILSTNLITGRQRKQKREPRREDRDAVPCLLLLVFLARITEIETANLLDDFLCL